MPIPFKEDPLEVNQRLLFPTNVFDLLQKDHDCFIFDDICRHIETSSIESDFSAIGQRAYHPRRIVSILIYAYAHGVFSSRQIEKRCHEDLGFMYIAHLGCPNFRVLSDFRKKYHEFFHACFKQSVLLAVEAGLASFGSVALDGSKFQANTSKHKAMSYGRLKEREKELTEEIEALLAKAQKCDEEEDQDDGEKTGYEIPEELKIKEKRLAKIKAAKEALEKREKEIAPEKEIEDKKQISFADKEARIMGKKGSFEYAYNGQISVDKDNQIIVGEHLTQNANDKKEVEPALEAMKETTGSLPKIMSMDNGYFSGENLATLQETSIDAHVAPGKEGKKDPVPLESSDRKVQKADFVYQAEGDCFQCPAGQTLHLASSGEEGKKVYRGHDEICAGCPYHTRCCHSKEGKARSISSDDKEPLRQAMMEKMGREDAKETYKDRKQIVEPVFGQIKNSGFRRFSVRGFQAARGEFSLVCAVHNFKKIVRALVRGVVRPQTWKRAVAAA